MNSPVQNNSRELHQFLPALTLNPNQNFQMGRQLQPSVITVEAETSPRGRQAAEDKAEIGFSLDQTTLSSDKLQPTLSGESNPDSFKKRFNNFFSFSRDAAGSKAADPELATSAYKLYSSPNLPSFLGTAVDFIG